MTKQQTLGDLPTGSKLVVAKIEMTLDYFSDENPCFSHTVSGETFYFIDRNWTRDTKISAVK